MKNRTKIILASFALLGSAIALTFCGGGGGAANDILANAPAGFTFTNTSGNAITSVSRGTAAQLRDSAGNILLQFTTGGTVNFTNVVAGRDAAKTFVHFSATTDKSGLSGTIIMFVPCGATANQVNVCPNASSLGDVTVGCAGEGTLTQTAKTSGNYTWDNATTHTGTDDCQVSASVDNFGTGAFSAASPTPVLTAEDFPDVGVCKTGTIDVTSSAFKAAIAGATSFTFMHKPWVSDADNPFICGRQGVWDPNDPQAFDKTNTLNMTDTLSNIFTGVFGYVFICNTGFAFASSNYGFHDATTYRGELKFTSGSNTYRGRVRFTVTGTDAGKTLAGLGLLLTDVTLTDASDTALTTVGDVQNLLSASPVFITVNAVAKGATHITATGGFICAGTE